MYIIVIGGGRVGYYLTRELLNEGNEVLIVERSAVICDTINEQMGNVCFRGDGCEAATLTEIGTGRADMLIAVTGDDEDNLIACQVAKHKFNVPRTVSRVRNPKNEALFKKLGVDVTVITTNIILEAIEKEVPTHPLIHLLTLEDKGVEVVHIKISASSAADGKTVRELGLPKTCKLLLVMRKEGKSRIPTSNTILRAGDLVIALIKREAEALLQSALTDITSDK